MRKILTALTLVALLPLGLPALAACDGRDLSGTLDAPRADALAARLDGIPYPRGNHWRATRGDSVLHLVGTIHVDDPRLDAPAARLRPLVEGAAALMLEMTEADRADLQRSALDRLVLDGATLPERLSDPDWQRLADAVRARGLPPFMVARMQPWYVALLLSTPACLDMREAAKGGLDARLGRMADGAGVPVSALENAADTLALFDDMPTETQMAMLRDALLPPARAEDLFETLMAAYLREAHAEGVALSTILATPDGAAPRDPSAAEALETALLDRRNRAWVPRMIAMAERMNGPVVAAFGAAHLGGQSGVLALLEAEGFTLDRQPF